MRLQILAHPPDRVKTLLGKGLIQRPAIPQAQISTLKYFLTLHRGHSWSRTVPFMLDRGMTWREIPHQGLILNHWLMLVASAGETKPSRSKKSNYRLLNRRVSAPSRSNNDPRLTMMPTAHRSIALRSHCPDRASSSEQEEVQEFR